MAHLGGSAYATWGTSWKNFRSMGTHDAKTLRAKARERAAQGSPKVQKLDLTTIF